MTYPQSHEPYNDDSQDAYTTQPVHYTGYGYQSITPPDGGYPAYAQPTSYGPPTALYGQQQQMAQPVSAQKLQSNKVMKRTKVESLALVSKLKKWIIAASVVSFGTLSFLVAGNVVGVTSHTSSTSSTSTSSKSSTTVTTPTQTTTGSSSSGSYFQQGQSSTQSNQGGYGIGNSNSSSQGAVSSSSTS